MTMRIFNIRSFFVFFLLIVFIYVVFLIERGNDWKTKCRELAYANYIETRDAACINTLREPGCVPFGDAAETVNNTRMADYAFCEI